MDAYLAVDQGTTSSRALVFARDASTLISYQKEFPQIYPQSGWVEHDPEILWNVTISVIREALSHSREKKIRIVGVGITNQRETVVVWDKKTGIPIYNAIVWQDRRTRDICKRMIFQGFEDYISYNTGLILDPYFSATKLQWILDNVEGARSKADMGELAAGTIDSFLIWRLTNGACHATDVTNASRTSLFNISSCSWDEKLLEIFNIPPGILPSVYPSAHNFGMTSSAVVGDELPISSVLGDQQSAAIGQQCFDTGSLKVTLGTGGFLLLNTGNKIVRSKSKLISTVLYKIKNEVRYALEGSIFNAGTTIQWLRDELQIIDSAKESEYLASQVCGDNDIYFVPGFTGLGAPHWESSAKAAIFGLRRDTGKDQIARAALESVAFQVNDVVQCMIDDGVYPEVIKVDGGMSRNNWCMQFLSDILGLPVEISATSEATALGVAMLASNHKDHSLGVLGIGGSGAPFKLFTPKLRKERRAELIRGWSKAVSSTISNI